jgi:hypothetical protein
METGEDGDGVSFVWCSSINGLCRGSVVFQFYAMVATSVTFGFEVLAPDGENDSFNIEVDQRGDQTWHVPRHNAWTWRAFTEITAVEAGLHVLTVHGRDDGTKLTRVRIEAGDVTFKGLPSPTTISILRSFIMILLPLSFPFSVPIAPFCGVTFISSICPFPPLPSFPSSCPFFLPLFFVFFLPRIHLISIFV